MTPRIQLWLILVIYSDFFVTSVVYELLLISNKLNKFKWWLSSIISILQLYALLWFRGHLFHSSYLYLPHKYQLSVFIRYELLICASNISTWYASRPSQAYIMDDLCVFAGNCQVVPGLLNIIDNFLQFPNKLIYTLLQANKIFHSWTSKKNKTSI